jgi:hypothetical protein
MEFNMPRYPDFAKLENLGFAFVTRGLWVNATKGFSVTFDESYRNTYRAYTADRPYYSKIVKNAAGNEMRFRSPEAAAAYVLKHGYKG